MTLHAKALHPNGNIGWRRMSKEPMAIILNLGISNNWAYINWQMIFFPVTLSVDFVRIYQPNDSVSITCDPPDHPTYDYIEQHKKAYYDNNATSWADAGYSTPKNILTDKCKSSRYKKN
ncbi:beta-glucan synthesis-associated protein [Zygosaccharomyces mellis]|uniref:Beta-glucan synthesis-associated protein n=1 Tax=Zygosaccharomyces mellis TaxID=42258 RepID=A0A4C2E5G7_9SACH|nr:beta-glucan synthesis-associated protein [Zygosaccharomyces mellis]